MSNRGRYAVWAIIFLLFGGGCYVFLRQDSYVAKFFGVSATFCQNPEKMAGFFADVFRYYIPDFCWGLSLALSLMAIYTPNTAGIFLCAAAATVCGLIWEVLQYCHAIRGTGDSVDMFMYLAAGVLAAIISRKVRKKT